VADDRHRDAPAFAGLADHVRGGDTRAVEHHLAELPGDAVDHAERVLLDPGWRIGTAKATAPCASGRRVGAREQEAPIGDVGVARPDLVPVDHVLVAVARRGGAQRGQVRPGVGLAEALTPALAAADQAGQEALLDRLAGVRRDPWTRYPRLGRGGAPAAASSSSTMTSKTEGRS
jgi:hypothetical protein